MQDYINREGGPVCVWLMQTKSKAITIKAKQKNEQNQPTREERRCWNMPWTVFVANKTHVSLITGLFMWMKKLIFNIPDKTYIIISLCLYLNWTGADYYLLSESQFKCSFPLHANHNYSCFIQEHNKKGHSHLETFGLLCIKYIERRSEEVVLCLCGSKGIIW